MVIINTIMCFFLGHKLKTFWFIESSKYWYDYVMETKVVSCERCGYYKEYWRDAIENRRKRVPSDPLPGGNSKRIKRKSL